MTIARKSLKEWLRDLTVHLLLAEEDIQGLKVYSDAETPVGTWVDGKTIYRKVYILNGNWAANTTSTLSVADLNIDTCINLHGFMTSSTYGHIGLDYYNSTFNFTYLNGLTTVYWKVGWAATKVTIIIEYTKQITS